MTSTLIQKKFERVDNDNRVIDLIETLGSENLADLGDKGGTFILWERTTSNGNIEEITYKIRKKK